MEEENTTHSLGTFELSLLSQVSFKCVNFLSHFYVFFSLFESTQGASANFLDLTNYHDSSATNTLNLFLAVLTFTQKFNPNIRSIYSHVPFENDQWV